MTSAVDSPKFYKVPVSLLVLICLLLFPAACDKKPVSSGPLSITGQTMGTSYHIKLNASLPQKSLDDLKDKIDGVLLQIEEKMSTYRDDSELSGFNADVTSNWIEVSPPLLKVIEEAQRIASLSGGAFDTTVGPLVEIWGFGKKETNQEIPNEETIQTLLKSTGYDKLELDVQHSRLKKQYPNLGVDLSAIAKGFAVDRVALLLQENGIDDFLVEIGGEIKVVGQKAKGKPWVVGVEKPLEGKRGVQLLLDLKGMGMATSGDYRNYFEQEGVRYSHMIDPRTGKPISHVLASVSVVHPSVMTADGWSTALMVLGPEKGLEIAQKQKLAAYFLVRTEGGFSQRATKEFQEYLLQPINNQP